jgi:glutathione peroxidase
MYRHVFSRFIVSFWMIVLGSTLMFSAFKTSALDNVQTAYAFTFHSLTGDKPLPLAQFKGKVLIIVNTASKCGFTPQYEGLEKLYETYKSRGLVIVGVPSNDFGAQEPDNNNEIANFCKLNYGVTFPMASKERVTGEKAHPFYRWARETEGFVGAPKWNFHKYLINRRGELVDYFHSTTAPDNGRLIAALEQLLAETETLPNTTE